MNIATRNFVEKAKINEKRKSRLITFISMNDGVQ